MSWDILVYAAKSPPPKIEGDFGEVLENFVGEPLGSTASVRERLSEVAPEIDWSDSEWGILDRNGPSIEFNIGKEEPCKDFMMHVRGDPASDELKLLFKMLMDRNGWYALDPIQEEWLHNTSNPMKGFEEFQKFKSDATAAALVEDAKPLWRRLLGL